ncbi:MAG: hypothetical protein HOI87_19455, partial [Rhodospirillaceae bacterium]|nr:hypothetical protein [Rhodospirillaceae bacterium]
MAVATVMVAKKGYKIFPVKSNGKEPVHSGWQDEAKPDATPWTNGADYNIGIAMGGGIATIDIDMKEKDGVLVDGEANWK